MMRLLNVGNVGKDHISHIFMSLSLIYKEENTMSANVETMFYVREKPWHGLGTMVAEAPASADALIWAGLDWEVLQKNVQTEDGGWITGYKANVRSTDGQVLGIVSDRYKVVQNQDAFQFTDELLGEVLPMRPPVPCRWAGRFGCWPGCRSGISSPGMRSRLTW